VGWDDVVRRCFSARVASGRLARRDLSRPAAACSRPAAGCGRSAAACGRLLSTGDVKKVGAAVAEKKSRGGDPTRTPTFLLRGVAGLHLLPGWAPDSLNADVRGRRRRREVLWVERQPRPSFWPASPGCSVTRTAGCGVRRRGRWRRRQGQHRCGGQDPGAGCAPACGNPYSRPTRRGLCNVPARPPPDLLGLAGAAPAGRRALCRPPRRAVRRGTSGHGLPWRGWRLTPYGAKGFVSMP
jgi:hypothetical protein